VRQADEEPGALERMRAWMTTALGRGGMVLLAIAVMVAVLVLVLLVLTWFSGLGPEAPGREHY
jgi:hypothetical protein